MTSTLLALKSQSLLRVEEAQKMLATCCSVEEAREVRAKAHSISVYLRQQKAAKDAQADAWEIKYRAETRIGELLRPEVEKRGREKSLPGDISRNHSSKWQRQARLAQEEPARYARFIESERERIIEGKTNRHGGEFSSDPDHDGDEWSTPREIVEAARKVLGGIDLDPASNPCAQRVVRATSYYTKTRSGLLQPWKGRVYCNPPYSLAADFAKKLLVEWDAGNVTGAVYLIVSHYTNNGSFQRLLREATAVCFPSGRIPFQVRGRTYSHHRQGHALFYFGAQPARFRAAFDQAGPVLSPVRRQP